MSDSRGGSWLTPRLAYGLVLLAGLGVVLAVNLPGHLSYDSVMQLYEGRFHVRETWGPAAYAWLLGVFDAVVPGTGFYVTASAVLLFACWSALSGLRGKQASWEAVGIAALAMATPQVAVYQGLVWKDIAFADTAIAGLTCVALAARDWARPWRRWAWLVAALALLSLASLVRQNGIIAGVMAAAALGWLAGRGGRWRRGIAAGTGAAIVLVASAQLLSLVALPTRAKPEKAVAEGVRIVQNYDLVGAMAFDPAYRIPLIVQTKPEAAAVIMARGVPRYRGDRIDWMDADPPLQKALDSVPDKTARREWLGLIAHHPWLYLKVRWEDFRWVFLTPDIDRCVPIFLGVDAPADKMKALGLQKRWSPTDDRIYAYENSLTDTPVFRHLTFVVIALFTAAMLARRRDPADIAIIALELAAVGFAASFFIISIACDYRYLYFTDLAAITGLIYLALDPPLNPNARGARRVVRARRGTIAR
jgi:hypothetical protein